MSGNNIHSRLYRARVGSLLYFRPWALRGHLEALLTLRSQKPLKRFNRSPTPDSLALHLRGNFKTIPDPQIQNEISVSFYVLVFYTSIRMQSCWVQAPKNTLQLRATESAMECSWNGIQAAKYLSLNHKTSGASRHLYGYRSRLCAT